MEQKNIKSLTKRQLLTLPGFTNLRNKTLKEIKQQLNVKLTELNLTRRGIKVRDYITAYNEKQLVMTMNYSTNYHQIRSRDNKLKHNANNINNLLNKMHSKNVIF